MPSEAAYIPYGRQSIDANDIAAVVEVLQSDYLTQGPCVGAFERALANCCGAAHAVAVCNATSALHLVCRALALGPGDHVWTTPITFVASANCARYCGAHVDFVDIDRRTWNLCPEALAKRLQDARAAGRPLPKIIIVVHFAGEPADMQRLAALGDEYGFDIVEDASHALGARHADTVVGSCRYSKATVFSFHPVKIVTAGEGGAVVTNDAALCDRVRRLGTHGIRRGRGSAGNDIGEPWYYEQLELGYNYRITDVQAALGLSQLDKLDDFIARREVLAARYDCLLQSLSLVGQQRSPANRSALHLYPVLLTDPQGDGAVRQYVFRHMRSAGIGVNVHYIPVHTQPYYRKLGACYTALDNAMYYYRRTLTLPLYPALDTAAQDRVIASLTAAMADALTASPRDVNARCERTPSEQERRYGA